MSGHDACVERSHRMARLLRHEVGDLLQSVYSTVAVLSDRLPESMPLERRLAADLKKRAELCRGELDAVVELASTETREPDRTDLAGVVRTVVSQVQGRYPALRFTLDPAPAVVVLADSTILSGGLWLLLAGLAQGAREEIRIRFERGQRYIDCMIEREGVSFTLDHLAWLRTPFATTKYAQLGLGLALTHRAVSSAGGEVDASNRAENAVVVRIRFPVCADG